METETTSGSQLAKGSLEGLTGDVTVSTLMAVSGEAREAVVKFFKAQEAAGVGRFVIGRKGGESRFVIGEKAKPKRKRSAKPKVIEGDALIKEKVFAHPLSSKRVSSSLMATLEHLRDEIDKSIERVKAFEDIVEEILG